MYLIIYILSVVCSVQNLMKNLPSHIINDPDLYSLEDLTEVKSGDLPTRLKDLVDVASEHLSDCQVNFFFIQFQ